jgi:pyruvate,water dikinase
MQAAAGAIHSQVALHKPVVEAIDWQSLSRGLRWALPRAHNAIRRREHTKSQLVQVAHLFKQGFRHLGALLVQEGKLPDADLVNFFTVAELGDVVRGVPEQRLALAIARREALGYQQLLEFPEISVGKPEPVDMKAGPPEDGVLTGRPASRGAVEGVARVVHTLEEAASLRANEILVTPITDIGWTPYFSMIAGLVTDLGSSVSHGAVIAREYGLPCVVNTRQGTRLIKTGDRIRLDGDSGKVTPVTSFSGGGEAI